MSTVNKNTAKALVANIVQLASLPSVYTRLEETLKNPNHTRDDIARVISIDPALSARTLRIINSSYYALSNPVQNISTAINLLGEYDLRNLVLVSSIVGSVACLVDEGFDLSKFWCHCIRCGITAKLLAVFKGMPEPELFFLSGLLHDIGQLVIYKNEPELFATVEWHVSHESEERYQVEQTLLGFDHAVVGSLLISEWGLTMKLKDMIEYHHQPELLTGYQKDILFVSLADQLVHFVDDNNGLATCDFAQLPLQIRRYLDELNIPDDVLPDLMAEVIEQSKAIEKIICNDCC